MPSRSLLLPSAILLLAGCQPGFRAPAPAPAPAPVPAAVQDSLIVAAAAALASDESGSWRAYTGDGDTVSLEEILPELDSLDVLFLGEFHDDPVAHALQHRIVREARERFTGARAREVVLSLEMFETDVQLPLDEYLRGWITEDHFLRSSRPWPNYRTDYRPMVEEAKARGGRVIAANPPRRYVNLVGRVGPDVLGELPAASRAFLPPLPVAPPAEAYRARWDALMGASGGTPGNPASHGAGPAAGGISNGLWAQTVWDAGMAHSIAGALASGRRPLVIHLAGSFHVDGGNGIPDHLRRARPGVRMQVWVFRPASGTELAFDPEDHRGLGDHVIVTDGSLPRTR